MADSGTGSGVTVAGGVVVGAFCYSSMGTAGWHVAQRLDLGGLTDDAVAEGARLIERLPWWPGEPLALGVDPYQRPRRLAWLGSGTSPRRFLVHTIHAENDASNRPDNNYTECLVVTPAPSGDDPSPSAEPADRDPATPLQPSSPRPSQLWAVEGWATPWGADAVNQARPGQHAPQASRPVHEVVEVISADSGSLLRLRCLLAALHRALHLGGPPVVGVVDDLIWGAVLLDTALALLPPGAAWEVTFDLRSLPPSHRFSPNGGAAPMVCLFGREHQATAVTSDALDLTSDADRAGLEGSLRHSDDQGCPRCGQWYASIDRLLRQGDTVSPGMLDRQLTELTQGLLRLRTLSATADRIASPTSRRDAPAEAAVPHLGHPNLRPVDHSSAAPLVRPGPGQHPVLRPPGDRAVGGSVAPSPVTAAGRALGGLDLAALDEAAQILADCRVRLLGLAHSPAAHRHLRAAWEKVRDIAEEELARLAQDAAAGIPPVRTGLPYPDDAPSDPRLPRFGAGGRQDDPTGGRSDSW